MPAGCDWVSKDWVSGFMAGLLSGIVVGAGLMGSILALVVIWG